MHSRLGNSAMDNDRWRKYRTKTLRRRRRLLLAGTAGLVIVFAGGRLSAAGTLLGLNPDEGATGTPYKVIVRCAEQPTLYGHPLDGEPPGTHVSSAKVCADSPERPWGICGDLPGCLRV